MARKGSSELNAPDWLCPQPAVLASGATAVQLSKRSCMSAVRIALIGAKRAGKRMSMAQLVEATSFSHEEIGSCLAKLQRRGAVDAEPRTYSWEGDPE